MGGVLNDNEGMKIAVYFQKGNDIAKAKNGTK